MKTKWLYPKEINSPYKSILILLLIGLSFYKGTAQNFDMEQIEQIWRPRLKVETKQLFPSAFADTSDKFSFTDLGMVCTFPLRSKLEVGLKSDLSSLKIKDMPKSSIRIKASQILGTFRISYKNLNLGYDSQEQRKMISAYSGILGLHLTRKYRIAFYSVVAGISEEDKSVSTAALRVNGILGQFHLKGIKRNYYYGVLLSYSDGSFLPVPFLGGMFPLGSKWNINYTLPAQIAVQYKPNNRMYVSGGLTVDGFRSGMIAQQERVNLNYLNAATYINFKHKINKSFAFKIDAGYNFIQYVNYTEAGFNQKNYALKPGIYFQAGITTLLGKNIFEQAAEALNTSIF